jgi:hypothetical protein
MEYFPDQPLTQFRSFFWPFFLGRQDSIGEVGRRNFGPSHYAQPGAYIVVGFPEGAPLSEVFEHEVALEPGEAGCRV